MRNANRQLKLKSRPTGLAGPDNFEETVASIRAPEDGEALLETVYLSVDPAMRVWLNEDPGYVPPIEIGEPARMQGFIVSDFQDRYDEARRWLSEKLKAGEIKQRLHVLDGLEKAPEGLTMLFEGTTTGKLVVKVAD